MLAAQCLLRSMLATLKIAYAHSFWWCEQAKPQLVIFGLEKVNMDASKTTQTTICTFSVIISLNHNIRNIIVSASAWIENKSI